MPKAATHTSAIEARRARGAGRSVELSGALGLLATALARARELPGRMADAAELRARLAAHRENLEVCLARAQCETATAIRMGRDFTAHRARATSLALDEEIADADAMLEEVARVIGRLRREVRALDHRLALCASLAADLPASPERARALELVERARASLTSRPAEAAAPLDALYTLTRVEAKQTGHAR